MSARSEATQWLAMTIADMTSGKYPELVETDFSIATKKMEAALAEMRAEKAARERAVAANAIAAE